jgi:methionyl-tRNA synthetase
VNVAGSKMSKTVGNVVDPNELIDQYGLDAFRYFFSRHIPTQDDGDFTWEKFENAYNNELGDDLGNLVQRVAGMVTRYQAGVVGDVPQPEHDMQPYRLAMEELTFNRALDEVWVTIRALNQYIDTVKPWEIAKKREKDSEAEAHLSEVLGYAVGTLRQVGDLLVPFLPTTAAAIHKAFDSETVQMPPLLFPRIYQHTPDPRAPKTAS